MKAIVVFTNLAIWFGSCIAISVAIIVTQSATPLWALIVPVLSTLSIQTKEKSE